GVHLGGRHEPAAAARRARGFGSRAGRPRGLEPRCRRRARAGAPRGGAHHGARRPERRGAAAREPGQRRTRGAGRVSQTRAGPGGRPLSAAHDYYPSGVAARFRRPRDGRARLSRRRRGQSDTQADRWNEGTRERGDMTGLRLVLLSLSFIPSFQLSAQTVDDLAIRFAGMTAVTGLEQAMTDTLLTLVPG